MAIVPPEEDREPVHAILDAVATRAEVDPLDLPPLYHSVDPDALVSLLESSNASVTVAFRYAGYEVTVVDGDEIDVRPFEPNRESALQ